MTYEQAVFSIHNIVKDVNNKILTKMDEIKGLPEGEEREKLHRDFVQESMFILLKALVDITNISGDAIKKAGKTTEY